LNNRFSGNEPSNRTHQTIQKQQSHPLSQNTTNVSSPLAIQQQPPNFRKSFHNSPFQKVHPSSSTTPPLNSSDTSNEGSIHVERQRPLLFRPRSRSLSSPSRSPISDNGNLAAMNNLFKERFPKAQVQMDDRLTNFINEFKTSSTTANRNRDSQPIVRFVTNQVVEIARDCLHKSHSKQVLNSRYFCEMSENLQRLLVETNEKSPEAAGEIARIIKKLILIISRPARLLECLEFDPEEFYKLLEAAEDQAKTHIASDLPIYIITKLGLNRDPLADLQQNNSNSSCEDSKEAGLSCDKTNPNNTSLNDSICDKSDLSIDKNLADTSIVSISASDSSCHTSTPKKGSQNQSMEKSGPNEHDYEILKLISNGAYGSVHLVKQKQTRQRFALKKINKNNLMLRNQVEQVFIERDILSFTDNPFVVSMYASFETRKHLCLVMEYVEGGDCASLLKNTGPLPSDMARLYFAEMVLAVEYLHR
jgi:microtubule-associated serine/threonine kinase